MTTVGEALTHEEVDEMFQEAGVGGDDFKINYVKFVEIMTKWHCFSHFGGLVSSWLLSVVFKLVILFL